MIFGPQISRPIPAADMEFYEGGLVMKMALTLSGYEEEHWNALSYRAHQRWLDRAVKATCRLFNDEDVVKRLPLLSRNLMQRV